MDELGAGERALLNAPSRRGRADRRGQAVDARGRGGRARRARRSSRRWPMPLAADPGFIRPSAIFASMPAPGRFDHENSALRSQDGTADSTRGSRR